MENKGRSFVWLKAKGCCLPTPEFHWGQGEGSLLLQHENRSCCQKQTAVFIQISVKQSQIRHTHLKKNIWNVPKFYSSSGTFLFCSQFTVLLTAALPPHTGRWLSLTRITEFSTLSQYNWSHGQSASVQPPSICPPRHAYPTVLGAGSPAYQNTCWQQRDDKWRTCERKETASSNKHCWFQCFLVLLFPLRENVVIERNIKLGLITESSILKRMLSAWEDHIFWNLYATGPPKNYLQRFALHYKKYWN